MTGNGKRLRWALAVAAVLAGGGIGAYRHFRHERMAPGPGVQALYQCPMHPQIVRSEPGFCPICRMRLQRVEEGRAAPGEAEGAASAVERAGYALSPERRQLIGVRTAVAEIREITQVLRSSGRVAHDPELYGAIAEHIQAARSLESLGSSAATESRALAESLVQSSRTRLRLMGLTDEMIARAYAAGAPPRHLLLTQGEARVWVYADIYQQEMSLVRPGLEVEARLTARPDTAFRGRVLAVDPVVDPMTRTARVRAEVDNREGLLQPEMYLDVLLRVPMGRRLAVPRDAVLDTGERQVVFVVRGDRFEPREVRVRAVGVDLAAVESGVRTPAAGGEELVEVVSGLKAGERVVSSANFLIDSESRLRAALEAFRPGGPQAGPGEGAAHRH